MNNATNNEAIILSEINVMGKIERQGNWKREWLLRTVITRITKVLLREKCAPCVCRDLSKRTSLQKLFNQKFGMFSKNRRYSPNYRDTMKNQFIINPSETSFVVKK